MSTLVETAKASTLMGSPLRPGRCPAASRATGAGDIPDSHCPGSFACTLTGAQCLYELLLGHG
jgi:hypothetical protein